MGKTSIQWVINPDGTPGHTVNPIRFRNKETGKVGHYCEKISAGCKNCYASAMQKPYLSGLEFTAENKGKGELFLDEAVLESVLRRRKPTSYFWCDCTDLFGQWVPDEWIGECFGTMAEAHWHQHMVLTKRAARLLEWSRAVCHYPKGDRSQRPVIGWPLNARVGVSVEDRPTKFRIDYLRETPAALRFLSLEPLLEDLGELDLRGIGWVIVGGESGPGARPMNPAWARSVRDQCIAAEVAYFHKQNGEFAELPPFRYGPKIGSTNREYNIALNKYKRDNRASGLIPEAPCDGDRPMARVGKRAAGRRLDGREWDELPAPRESGKEIK